jgi:hypothetical protein
MAIFDGGSSDYPLHDEGKFKGRIREVVAIPPKEKVFDGVKKLQYGRLIVVENCDGKAMFPAQEGGQPEPATATLWFGLYAEEGKVPYVGSKSKPFKLYAQILGKEPNTKPFDDEQILGAPVDYFVETSEDGQYSNVISIKACDGTGLKPNFKSITQAERAALDGDSGGSGEVVASVTSNKDDLPF